ncbi:Eco57I restriction-modification methylase domain-containing protein [Lyngbya confervoides]|uniref:site-specific DNA-methyltransferase (adenine-specific) n=1 Tax=Lyngbya confervoides BDU141951 TaxID=1574623 RepID=A0ABD4T5H4_9CYAN|nr:DNA methyltransferase [Lyngbya confervoides]MCM1983779.1 restriction endonuclease [Lyngbya confervoides BDU141951]
MSIARHHAEWLSLVEASGPFLSLPVLEQVFPQGLEAHEPEHRRRLVQAYEEWQDNQQGLKPEREIHRAWVAFVLTETLEFPEAVLKSGQEIPNGLTVRFEVHQETVRPDWVVMDPIAPDAGKGATSRPRLLVQYFPPEQNLDKSVKGSRWAASPATRMMELLHACDVRLGLITNGEHWMLVNAPKGETTGYISWYANLWQEEAIALRSFRSLLWAERFFNVPEEETLEAMLAQSVNSQQEVTDQLGFQVRKAVEVLVQSIDRIDLDRNRELLVGVSETRLYEAALTVMMRLVFLLFAEENKLIPPHETEFYEAHYAVSTLREQLRELADQQGEEILERKQDAWCRLLATFRAVYGGVYHDALMIPAYGGSLFDPDRFPFLEGRKVGSSWEQEAAVPMAINNRTVLHLLEALQVLQMRVSGGVESRKLSFRALDIEQIGHVYEGLLDHTAVRSEDPILGLAGTKNQEPEVSLVELERLRGQGEEALLKFLRQETGRGVSPLKKALALEADAGDAPPRPPNSGGRPRGGLEAREAQRLLIACGNDEELYERVLPWARLLREDTFGYPVVIPAGSVYVTEGSDRRQTGTHYTPRSLTEEIVKYTLEPLVYEGVAEGEPEEKWRLRSAAEILKLKVCDMAMGSGAFLVQTCRYLAERLVEAWELNIQNSKLKTSGSKVIQISPDGSLSVGAVSELILPSDEDERLAVARRIVADRCLYGVDKNPLAVEMAKLSLWLITLQKNKPFTFLDHALRCGDSLIGVSLEQLRYWNMDTTVKQEELFADQVRRDIGKVIDLRRQIAALGDQSVQAQKQKGYLLAQANARANNLRDGCDLLLSAYFNTLKKSRQEDARKILLRAYRDNIDVPEELAALLGNENVMPFHWELEFPEVFVDGERQGFDAIVGNPPFQGGKKISTFLGLTYRHFIGEHIANSVKGSADLCGFFLLRAGMLIDSQGTLGLIATNTISQGDTREVSLEQLLSRGFSIPRAVPSRPWPGAASLEVAQVWLHKGEWNQKYILENQIVEGITAFLTVPGKIVGSPYRLAANQNKSFQGTVVLGTGFILESDEAASIITKNPENAKVIFPYLNGQDLNSRPDQSPSRQIINFFNWPLDAENDDPENPKGPPYASDFPDCLAILTERVKPQRDEVVARGKQIHEYDYWKFWDKRPELYGAIADCDRVLAIPLVSKYCICAWEPSNFVYSHALGIISSAKTSMFTLIQSNIHEYWSRAQGSTLETRMRYTPSDCFETFPFPKSLTTLGSIGETYYTHRQSIMRDREEGLTKTYNRFHDPDEQDEAIQTLRDLHIQMDQAVASAYGWDDLNLDHSFHDTKQGLRFTISEAARREVLDRLLELNHQRYAEEVALGLHEKKKKKGTKGRSKGTSKKKSDRAKGGQLGLF